jgi:CRISPR-associated protein Cmr2
MIRAGFSEDEVDQYDHEADWVAAAADRFPFPASKTSGLTCAFDGQRNGFHHPLAGTHQIKFKPIESDQLGTEIEQNAQPSIYPNLEDQPNFWRNKFFAHWRLWRTFAQERDYRLAFLPADTRIPDHTIWNHMQVVSALAGANLDGGPAFLRLQIGGVQEFIAQARTTRDLWSGSYLISWLMVSGLKLLTAQVGPDAVVFPSLIGQPLFDLHWKNEIWEKLRAAADAESFWKGNLDRTYPSLKTDAASQLVPNLPNVFLAIVPANKAEALGQATAAAIVKELNHISKHVWREALKAGIVQSSDETRYNDQISRFLNISWQAQAWPNDLDSACRLAEGAPQNSPLANAQAGIECVRRMAEVEIPQDHRDARYYTDSAKTKLKSIGLAWSAILAHQQRALDSVRQTRAFSATLAGRWDVGRHNTKDALIGRDEAIVGGAELADRVKKAGGYWPSMFKKNDPVSALTLLKRTWHRAYLASKGDEGGTGWGFSAKDFEMPNTRGIAAHKPDSNLDDEADVDEIEASEKYFAVLVLDGDEIGKWVSGVKTPKIKDQLANYSDGSGNHTEGSLPYFKRIGLEHFLATRRPLSPSYHLQFSEALGAFALRCARPIVEAFDGRLIYAGGDDVLALLPADTALRCGEALRAAFQGSAKLDDLLKLAPHPLPFRFHSPAPGFLARSDYRVDMANRTESHPIPFVVPGPGADVSVGIAIAHFKAPLQDVVRAAQLAEKRAKASPSAGGLDRSAFSIRLMKHSGEILDWGARWDTGGMNLYHALAECLKAKQLSSTFPHRLFEILAPFENRSDTVKDAEGFPTSEIIESEFERLLVQHEKSAFDPTDIKRHLKDYLSSLESENRTPSDVASHVIGLATAVAFLYRTKKDSSSTQVS